MKLLSLCLIALAAVPLQDQKGSARAIELGREHAAMFYEAEHETLWERLGGAMRTALGGSVTGLQAAHGNLTGQLGKEVELLRERTPTVPSGYAYVREARFEKTGEMTLEFVWQFDADEKVIGFQISPKQTEAESRFLDYETKTELQLPIVDPWHVFWGGRSLEENYHTAYPDQRFAYDLLIMKGGKTHEGDPKKNESYFCWGKHIVAPGAGVVVSVANDVVDNVPGEMNPRQALGNHVILDHGNGEFSFLAHFQKGSVQVKDGEEVEAGAFLGLAGNSGNTSEPHLHYHLQTTPKFNAGEGLPSQFLNYRSNGELIERGEPAKGEVIEPAE